MQLAIIIHNESIIFFCRFGNSVVLVHSNQTVAIELAAEHQSEVLWIKTSFDYRCNQLVRIARVKAAGIIQIVSAAAGAEFFLCRVIL